MMKKVIILLLILPFFIFGVVTTMFVYSEQTQNFMIKSFNLKGVLNKKVKSFIVSTCFPTHLEIFTWVMLGIM